LQLILNEPHLLTTPVREVYIRSCRQKSFIYDDALPALSHKSFKATNYGQATLYEKWHMMCIDDNKVALFTQVDECRTRTYLVVDRAGTLLEIRGQIYPDKKTSGQLKMLKVLSNLVLLLNHLPNATFVVITVIILCMMDL